MAQPTTRRAWLTGTIVGAIGALIGRKVGAEPSTDRLTADEADVLIRHQLRELIAELEQRRGRPVTDLTWVRFGTLRRHIQRLSP